MCGIVGAYGFLNHKEERVFTDLLLIDTIRGPHSTGVLNVVQNTYVPRVFKKAVDAYCFVKNKEFKDLLQGWNLLFLGHNRWATTGKVVDSNSHPFVMEDIIGVHNGTLDWGHELPDKKDFNVDSENIMYAINKQGVEETWKQIRGAAALVWWNTKEKSLNFLRNKERPLWYCHTFNSLLFASEAWMMNAALSRNDMKVEKEGDQEWFNTKVNVHYKIYLTDLKLNIEETVLEPAKEKVFPVTNYWRGENSYDLRRTIFFTLHKAEKHCYLGEDVNYDPVKVNRFTRGKILELGVSYSGEIGYEYWEGNERCFVIISNSIKEAVEEGVENEQGDLLTPEEFRDQYMCCYVCGEPYDDLSEVIVFSEDEALCSTCVRDYKTDKGEKDENRM